MEEVARKKAAAKTYDTTGKEKELREMAISMRMHYSGRQVSNMFIAKLIDYLYKSTFDSMKEKGIFFVFYKKRRDS